MADETQTVDPHFFQLIMSLQAGGMHQLGKVANPMTGEIERDLPMAKMTIDLLAMIKDKTQGNLSDDEDKLLSRMIYELQLNYVDESKKPDPAKKEEADETSGEEAAESPSEPKAGDDASDKADN